MTTTQRLDPDKLLKDAATYAVEYKTYVQGVNITGRSGTISGSQETFVRECERRLRDIEERGSRNQMSLVDVDELLWLRSCLYGTPSEPLP